MYENSSFRTITRGLAVPFALMALLGSVFVAGAFIIAANGQDRIANEAAAHLVRGEIERLRHSVEQTAFDFSYWDQAVENLVERFDPVWADENIGPYLRDTHGIDSSYVLDPDNRLVYGFSAARVDPFARFAGGVDSLVERARHTAADAQPVPVWGFLRDGNTFNLAVACALTTYKTVNGRRQDKVTPWVLLLAVELNPRKIAEIASHIEVTGLTIPAATPVPAGPHLALAQADGRPIGLITWQAAHPGREMLVWALPGLGGILLFLSGMAGLFIRRAAKTTRLLERQTATAIEQKTRSEHYLAAAGTMMVALDGDGRVTLVNRKACEILGCDEAEIMGADWLETAVAAEHRAIQRRVLEAALAGRIEVVREHETLVVTKSGQRLIAWYNNVVEAPDGTIVGTLSSGHDITAKRQAEEALRQVHVRFQAILDHSPSSIFLKDLRGRYVFANKEFARRARIPVEDVVGKTDYDFLDTDMADRIEVIDGEVMESRQTRQAEITLTTPEGRRTIMSLRFPILDDAGELIGIGGIGTDITERERAKAAAQKLQGELAQVLRLGTVGEIASGLAQEINQPLTAIMNYAVGMLRRLRSGGVQPEDTLRVFEIVAEQAQRAGDIVRRMRQFARREGPVFIDTDINQAIREALDLVTPDASVLKVAIEFDFDDSLPPVLGNAVQLQQAILNLARNALDAMASQSGSLTPRRLTVCTRRTEAGLVEITVSDTGPGIGEKIRSRVLDPFFSTHEGSMGMGLPICRTIITAHGGTLWFTTGPDRGTTFHFTLPITAQAVLAEPAVGKTASPA